MAALIIDSGLRVEGVYGVLRGTAHDTGAAGVDDRSGDGFIQADQATLPVELVTFEGATGRDVILTWQTASETNNVGFRVEHRQRDGTFERRAFVSGVGTTVGAQPYQYRAPDFTPGRHAFQLGN